MNISENIARVRERMSAACQRAGRRLEDVKLIAVSKTFPPERIREAFQAGLRDFGENRVQEAASKVPSLRDLQITWHLVGHLQSNKARRARELFQWVDSVDSVGIARKLEQVAEGAGRLPILLEINLGGEETKSGLGDADLAAAMADVAGLQTLDVRGLMLIPPYFADPEQGRPFFRRLRELSEKLFAHLAGPELSMGMSHDFEIAIEEGATMIRVGTAIFGPR